MSDLEAVAEQQWRRVAEDLRLSAELLEARTTRAEEPPAAVLRGIALSIERGDQRVRRLIQRARVELGNKRRRDGG